MSSESVDLQARGEPKRVKRSLAIVFLIMLMDVVGVSLMYPVAAFIVERYSGQALMVTMLTVIYAAAQFFSAPLLGKLGDRYGRRPVLLVSLLGSVIGYILFGIGGALWILFLARLLDGVTAGNMSTATAYIIDISAPAERPKNLGLIGVAWGVGLILGPVLGAVLGQIALVLPAFAAAGLSTVNLVLAFFFLPESLARAKRQTGRIQPRDLNPFASIGALARLPMLGQLFLALCLFNFAFNGINATQTVFLIEKFTAQPWQLGTLLVVAGITVAVVQSTLVARLVKRFGERSMAVLSLFGQALAATGIFFSPAFWVIFPFTVLNSSMSTLTFPTVGTLAANRVTDSQQGLLAGVTTALGSLMSIFGPLAAGLAYDRVMHGSPYWIAAILYGLAALVLLVRQPAPRKEPA